MKTILRGRTREVEIDTEGQVVIIGESINPTRRKRLITTLQGDNFDYVLELAESQINEGADILDVNVGFPGVEEVELLPRVVMALQEKFDIPLCLDSPNPAALESALKVSKGRCLINSVNGNELSMVKLLPIAKEYDAAIIGLCIEENGITSVPERRAAIAEKIVERAIKAGMRAEDVIIDPVAMAVSADPDACLVTLRTIKLVHERLGHNITIGASNVSFGLPGRESLNSAFVVLAILNGLSCPIANPGKIAAAIRSTDLLMGRDEYAARFVEYFQRRV